MFHNAKLFRTHFIRVGHGNNDTAVTMIQLSNLNEVGLSNVPLPEPPFYGYSPHRKTCSIFFDKNQKKTLIVLTKHHLVQEAIVLHSLALNTMEWSKRTTNLKHFGSLVVAKGIWYYFNVLNKDGNLGSYFDSKLNTWQTLEMRSYTEFPNFTAYEHEFPIVTVPYTLVERKVIF